MISTLACCWHILSQPFSVAHPPDSLNVPAYSFFLITTHQHHHHRPRQFLTSLVISAEVRIVLVSSSVVTCHRFVCFPPLQTALIFSVTGQVIVFVFSAFCRMLWAVYWLDARVAPASSIRLFGCSLCRHRPFFSVHYRYRSFGCVLFKFRFNRLTVCRFSLSVSGFL